MSNNGRYFEKYAWDTLVETIFTTGYWTDFKSIFEQVSHQMYNWRRLINQRYSNGRVWVGHIRIYPGADPGFGQGGGPQLLRPNVADVAKRSHTSEASILRLGSRARLRALEAFGFLMLKYAFSHILETLFLLFLTSILTPKVDKNKALDFTSINLRHCDMLHLFFNLHEKVML